MTVCKIRTVRLTRCAIVVTHIVITISSSANDSSAPVSSANRGVATSTFSASFTPDGLHTSMSFTVCLTEYVIVVSHIMVKHISFHQTIGQIPRHQCLATTFCVAMSCSGAVPHLRVCTIPCVGGVTEEASGTLLILACCWSRRYARSDPLMSRTQTRTTSSWSGRCVQPFGVCKGLWLGLDRLPQGWRQCCDGRIPVRCLVCSSGAATNSYSTLPWCPLTPAASRGAMAMAAASSSSSRARLVDLPSCVASSCFCVFKLNLEVQEQGADLVNAMGSRQG